MVLTRRLYGLLSVLFLVMGMGIYLVFRNLDMILFDWLPKPEFLNDFFIPLKSSPVSAFLLYNLPDTLWFLSGILFLRCVWFYEKKWLRIYLGCFYAIALVIEISQLAEGVPGTFDPLDLLCMGISALVEGLLYNMFIKRRSS